MSSKAGIAVPGSSETVFGDICDAAAVTAIVRGARPTHVVHLAAISHIPTSFSNPLLTWQTNVMGSVNLLEAVQSIAPEAFMLFVSTADVYGAAFNSKVPAGEATACIPLNPYAASKLAAEAAFNEYFRRGIAGTIVRPFNHIGAHQSSDFVIASFARQIALIESGKQPATIKVGNLDSFRDFLDVLDVCHAYKLILGLPESTADYPRCLNISSGSSQRIADMLQELLLMCPLTVTIEQDPARMRPTDIPFAAGNSELVRKTVGWSPTKPLRETLQEMLSYWRTQAGSGR